LKKSEKWMLFAVLGAVVIVGLCLVCVVGAVLVPMRWWSQGGAAGAAKDYLAKSTVVASELGVIREFGKFPRGSESTFNGKGTAHLVISIIAERGEGTAEVDLTKEPGKAWTVTGGTLTVAGKSFPLEAGQAAPATPLNGPQGDDSAQPEGKESWNA
jgi:hypothetical protein